ncbi:MAG: HAMP domain-containing sensor histidine kinase [Melioribacteraceae bacterium]
MFNVIKKIQSSIFTKLILVLIIVDIITIMIVIKLGEIYIGQHFAVFEKNIIRYTNYLMREIGTPPDTVKAGEISQELSVKIRFESPDFKWSTHDNVLSFKDFNDMNLDKNKSNICVKELAHGVWAISRNHSSGRYLFAFDFGEIEYIEKLLSVVLIVLFTIIFTTAYFLIRWVLKPIYWLGEGVEQISKGNLSHNIRSGVPDELGVLAESFNLMTKRVREMIRSKDQLLLDVSHELRSPLTRIRVALESIPQNITKDSITEDLKDIEKMITEILETERLTSSHGKLYLKEANISDIIKEVVQSFEDKSPGVKLISVPENVTLCIDVDRVKIVLKNVLENSVKYSKPENQPVEISVDDEEKWVVIRIKDYGLGIPEEELPFIFEPFYRVDKSRSKVTGGYGLGMSLCKKIMDAHDGFIEINSKLDIGTTVYLRFVKQ